MNEYIGTISTAVVLPLLSVITGFIVAFVRKKTLEIEQKINNEKATKYLNIADDTVCTAVVAVNQVMVDELKKSGTFDQLAKEEAFETARQKVLTVLGDAGKKALSECYGDVDTWLNNKIQYYVNKNKTAVNTTNIVTQPADTANTEKEQKTTEAAAVNTQEPIAAV